MLRIILFLSLVCPAIVLAEDGTSSSVSQPLKASEKVILTVKTSDTVKNYTLSRIEALGLRQLVTSTFWSNKPLNFSGVLLSDLLEDAGLGGVQQIRVAALDGYHAIIPENDWRVWEVLVATRQDKKPITIREKGPLRIVYPKDIGGAVAETDMRVRWVWAMKSIERVE